MQNVQPRATLRDIARQSGYHYSTVSLALREHPRIPAGTRDRIRKIAEALDYRPDAALSALCAYREQKLPAHRQSVIAWLTNHRTAGQWQRSACNRDYFAGASLRAAERGYTIECIWLAEPGMTGRRMSQILWTRGIQGILLPPQERICSIDLDWDKLSAVTFGYTLVEPKLNLVTNHDYRTMGKLFAELQRRRYHRVGLVNLRDHDERVDHSWLAAYLIEENRVSPKDRLAPLIMDRWSDQLFLAWFAENRPDAIVTRLPEVLSCLEHADFRVPADVGVAFHSLDEERRDFSGMKKNSFQIGIMAVDLLVDMLHRNERGIPEMPYMLMVEGSWCEGRTLRPAARQKSKSSRRPKVPASWLLDLKLSQQFD